MGFWEKDFLNRRRQEWMESIHKFQYQVNGNWYDAKINSKKITGNKIVFIVSLLTTPKTAHTITGIAFGTLPVAFVEDWKLPLKGRQIRVC